MRQSLWSATVSEHHSALSAAHLGLSVQHASVDMRRDINMLGGHGEDLHFRSQGTTLSLWRGRFWIKMGFVVHELKCINKNTKALSFFSLSGTLIRYSKFLSAAVVMKFCPSSVYLSSPRSPRLSCLRLASEYQQPISICHSCQAHNATKEPGK